jgi:hypothetical protein
MKQDNKYLLDQQSEIDFNDPYVQKRIKSIKKFFEQYDIDVDEKFEIPNLELKSKAYPNFESYFPVSSPRNLQKWLKAIQDIYNLENSGIGRHQALFRIIGRWDDMEKLDFMHWLRFYEEGNHLKYKTASNWYEGIAPGYILPLGNSNTVTDYHKSQDSENSESLDKRQIIEKQRSKIIGRLDSTEKLLRSQEGQLFAGKEFETLLEIIYQLKKKIQMINKKSASTKLYEDLIIREANVLKRDGFIKAAHFLYTVAQMPSDISTIPAPMPPASPTDVSGSPTTVPVAAIGNTPPDNNPPDIFNKKDEQINEGISEFLSGLKGGNISGEIDKADDALEINDSNDELVVEAQVVSKDTATVSSPASTTQPVKADEKTNIKLEDNSKTFDNLIDAAFANIKVDDVINKLEELSKIFKIREVPRQLAIVDMMLDTLGLSSFFPSLAEATNKSLESNQYILTRIEDVLSKLRGSLESINKIDISPEDTERSDVKELKKQLQHNIDKEKARKLIRKELEDQALEQQVKETPSIKIEEDLATPTTISTSEAVPTSKPATSVQTPSQTQTK